MQDFISKDQKMLSAIAYAFGIPSLYIVLTDLKKQKFVGFHGCQAFLLWVLMLIIWLFNRWVFGFVLSSSAVSQNWVFSMGINWLIWFYALFCAFRCLSGSYFFIPGLHKLINLE